MKIAVLNLMMKMKKEIINPELFMTVHETLPKTA